MNKSEGISWGIDGMSLHNYLFVGLQTQPLSYPGEVEMGEGSFEGFYLLSPSAIDPRKRPPVDCYVSL